MRDKPVGSTAQAAAADIANAVDQLLVVYISSFQDAIITSVLSLTVEIRQFLLYVICHRFLFLVMYPQRYDYFQKKQKFLAKSLLFPDE